MYTRTMLLSFSWSFFKILWNHCKYKELNKCALDLNFFLPWTLSNDIGPYKNIVTIYVYVTFFLYAPNSEESFFFFHFHNINAKCIYSEETSGSSKLFTIQSKLLWKVNFGKLFGPILFEMLSHQFILQFWVKYIGSLIFCHQGRLLQQKKTHHPCLQTPKWSLDLVTTKIN